MPACLVVCAATGSASFPAPVAVKQLQEVANQGLLCTTVKLTSKPKHSRQLLLLQQRLLVKLRSSLQGCLGQKPDKLQSDALKSLTETHKELDSPCVQTAVGNNTQTSLWRAKDAAYAGYRQRYRHSRVMATAGATKHEPTRLRVMMLCANQSRVFVAGLHISVGVLV